MLLLIISLFAFRLWQTTGCRKFVDFRFTSLSVKINVENQVSFDKQLNRNISRIFHNKAQAAIFEITKSYLQTLDPRLILQILGPVGTFLALVSTLKLAQKSHKAHLIHFGLILLSSLAAIILFNSKVAFYLIAFSWQSFSLWGLYFLKNTKINSVVIFLLILASVWYYALSWQLNSACYEIYFN